MRCRFSSDFDAFNKLVVKDSEKIVYSGSKTAMIKHLTFFPHFSSPRAKGRNNRIEGKKKSGKFKLGRWATHFPRKLIPYLKLHIVFFPEQQNAIPQRKIWFDDSIRIIVTAKTISKQKIGPFLNGPREHEMCNFFARHLYTHGFYWVESVSNKAFQICTTFDSGVVFRHVWKWQLDQVSGKKKLEKNSGTD